MKYVFRSSTHPEASGRKALPNEEQFPMFFGLEDGGKVTVLLGREGFINIAACILQSLSDDPELLRDVQTAIPDVQVERFLALDTRRRN